MQQASRARWPRGLVSRIASSAYRISWNECKHLESRWIQLASWKWPMILQRRLIYLLFHWKWSTWKIVSLIFRKRDHRVMMTAFTCTSRTANVFHSGLMVNGTKHSCDRYSGEPDGKQNQWFSSLNVQWQVLTLYPLYPVQRLRLKQLTVCLHQTEYHF